MRSSNTNAVPGNRPNPPPIEDPKAAEREQKEKERLEKLREKQAERDRLREEKEREKERLKEEREREKNTPVGQCQKWVKGLSKDVLA
eukprot:6255997-Alexandrium_andersonii.AAC.1